jgi:DNA-binding NarL/FixJ family response regulator
MASSSHPNLNLDDIYESAFIADVWPTVLGHLAETAGAVGGGFFILNGELNGEVSNWTSSEGFGGTMLAFVNSRVLQTSGRPTRVNIIGQHSFITEQQSFSGNELDDHPLYRDFLRPRGLGWSARTSIRLPTGDNIVLALERAFSDGPIPMDSLAKINEHRSHLARAAFISARLQLETAKTATQTLALLGLPALAFDPNGRVLSANSLTNDMKDYVVFRAHERIALTDKRANLHLMLAIESASHKTIATPFSFSVCNTEGQAQLVAHVIPVRGQSRDVFMRCAGVLILTPVSAPQIPSIDLVQSLFDFTPAEARVARSIAQGESVEVIASANEVSVNTIRAQVRSVLEKTGCHRQAEVASLLGGLSVIRG